MEENSVSGFCNVDSRSLGSKHNPEVSVEEREPDQGKTNIVWSISFPQTVSASEHEISGTKQSRVKKLQWLCSQKDEQIWEDREWTRSPDQTNQDVGFLDSTDLSMMEGDTDGDVTLDCHAGQIEWCVEGGGNGNDQQDEAEGRIHFVQGVADDVKEGWQDQLHHVIYHQVDEQNVTRVWIKDLNKIKLVLVE